ncbi:MAG TPA: hypothetical protein VGR06_35065, partial [Actinophytocola sp.]|uniref:hypothetical protein n=1 Tax=Actinophytocola sp. TaxID=1872138 RepID=UPI002DF7D547|nr:hypothetical protein [Actinophytocola sp.]
LNGPGAIHVLEDGRFVFASLATSTRVLSVIERRLPSGAFDPTFSEDGWFVLEREDFGDPFWWLNSIAVLPDGRILAAASVYLPDSGCDRDRACDVPTGLLPGLPQMVGM